jgi:pSer/pThr/pTyr-binding forkhead associated (FHA) protein
VGRAPNNDIYLDHPTVSKFHAYFRKVAGDWRLLDANSQNGTWVRGELVRGETAVRDGDAIAFGHSPSLTFLEPLKLYHVIRGFSPKA